MFRNFICLAIPQSFRMPFHVPFRKAIPPFTFTAHVASPRKESFAILNLRDVSTKLSLLVYFYTLKSHVKIKENISSITEPSVQVFRLCQS